MMKSRPLIGIKFTFHNIYLLKIAMQHKHHIGVHITHRENKSARFPQIERKEVYKYAIYIVLR